MSSVSPFELPPELLLIIFAFACRDEGKIGCSLGLVSKTIRGLVQTSNVDLQSIALRGGGQMVKFLGAMERRQQLCGPNDRPKIKWLFISVRPKLGLASSGDDTSTTTGRPLNRVFLFGHRPWVVNYPHQYVHRIFNVVDPTHLSYLTIDFTTARMLPSMLPVPFPNLIDLTVSGPVSSQSFLSSCPAPRLERLHVASHHELPRDLWKCITDFAPSLVGLEITGIGPWNSPEIIASIEAYLHHQTDLPTTPSLSEPTTITTDVAPPPTLNLVHIGFTQTYLATGMRGGDPSLMYHRMDRRLQELASRFGDGGHSTQSGRKRLTVAAPPPRVFEAERDRIETEKQERLWYEWIQKVEREVLSV